jgi:hypothetical protein
VAGKATIVDKQKARSKVMKGGVLSCINERNEIIGWVMRMFQSHNETLIIVASASVKQHLQMR